MKFTVIDNFLKEEELNALREVLYQTKFDWHFTDKITIEQNETDNFFYFCHVLYNQKSLHTSEYFPIVYPILRKLEPKALIRVKANLYINQGEGVKEHAQHTDEEFTHKGALFSLNTCDGYTKLGNEKVESIANRIVLFDPSIPHASTSTSNSKVRMNINFNYF